MEFPPFVLVDRMMSAVWAPVLHALPFMDAGSADKPGKERGCVLLLGGGGAQGGLVGSQWGDPNLLSERALRNGG